MYLIGDIGGTKTQLAILSLKQGFFSLCEQKTFINAHYHSLPEMINEYLARGSHQLEEAVLGVAGPVINGCCQLTNLPWAIDSEVLRQELKFDSVTLLNDLEAMAYIVPYQTSEVIYTLSEGKVAHDGPIILLSAGTGLGQAYITQSAQSFTVYPSEGGHADFAPTNALQRELLSFMQTKFEHVSYELLCSGTGLKHIYQFLLAMLSKVEADKAWAVMDKKSALVPQIIHKAITSPNCSLCKQAVSIFTSILGAQAGNLALHFIPTGGIYLGGGVVVRLFQFIKKTSFFRDAFLEKGRFSTLMENFPIHFILSHDAPLIGAACYLAKVRKLNIYQIQLKNVEKVSSENRRDYIET